MSKQKIKNFVEHNCILDNKHYSIPITELYNAFITDTDSSIDKKEFTKCIEKLGYKIQFGTVRELQLTRNFDKEEDEIDGVFYVETDKPIDDDDEIDERPKKRNNSNEDNEDEANEDEAEEEENNEFGNMLATMPMVDDGEAEPEADDAEDEPDICICHDTEFLTIVARHYLCVIEDDSLPPINAQRAVLKLQKIVDRLDSLYNIH